MQGVFLPLWVAAALVALAILSFIQFRHIGLTVLTLAGPLPAVAAAMTFGMAPDPVDYLFGFLCGAILSTGIGTRICDGETARDAAHTALRRSWALVLWPPLVAVALSVLTAGVNTATLSSAAVICGNVVSSLAIVFFIARSLPYSENFITRMNRVRESRERFLDALAFVVQPRWGWSVSGIGLVFAALGYFGAGEASWSLIFLFGAVEAAIMAAAAIATRSIRRTLAFAFTGAILICLTAWLALPVAAASVPALAIAPALVMAMQSARFAREGDRFAVATLRSFEVHAVTIVFFATGAALTLWLFARPGGAILVAAGAPAALLAFPALVTMLYDLVPPRVSLDAYRTR
ncbi:MAG TPA: hypothetical protein VG867_07010 [Rhizomicrobium sp.]|nr:hypothetical protein [Rhizomicrobium sp.]